MLNRIDPALAFQAEALKLRSHRQSLLAANIANADTPNYRAVDFDFRKALSEATAGTGGGSASAAVRPPVTTGVLERASGRAGLDGNTVDLDVERVQFADNALRYEATLRFLNGKLRTLLSAIQG